MAQAPPGVVVGVWDWHGVSFCLVKGSKKVPLTWGCQSFFTKGTFLWNYGKGKSPGLFWRKYEHVLGRFPTCLLSKARRQRDKGWEMTAHELGMLLQLLNPEPIMTGPIIGCLGRTACWWPNAGNVRETMECGGLGMIGSCRKMLSLSTRKSWTLLKMKFRHFLFYYFINHLAEVIWNDFWTWDSEQKRASWNTKSYETIY